MRGWNMAIKDKRDTVPKSKDMTDVKTEIAIARYEAYRRQPANKPVRLPKP
jgi:hypothetical protein